LNAINFFDGAHQMAKSSNRNRKSTSQSKGRRTSMPFLNDVIGIAGSLLRSRQEAGSEKIITVAEATRGFASDFADFPHIQTYVNGAADQMDALADYVAEADLEDMISDAGRFAKRYPMATMAFAIASGFAFTRIMASKDRSTGSQDDQAGRHPPGRRASRGRSTGAGTRAASAKKAKPNGRDTTHAASHGS
jgi:hypothetical protein